jgi:hypothetical protein
MSRLYVAARRLTCLYLTKTGPKRRVILQRVHHDFITRRCLRMSGASVVLMKDWVVNYRSSH